jgi:membrane protease subunit HflK
MSWNKNGGSGGGWKSGSGGPWGQGPIGGGGPGGNQPPDLEEILKRSQDRLKQAMPGGIGTAGFMVIFLGIAAAVAYFGFTVRVDADQVGVVQRFGKLDRQLPPGLNFRLPFPIEQVSIVNFTTQNRVEVGFRAQGTPTFGGQVGPVRDVQEESLMLTGDENIVDVDFNVFWRVKNAADFLFNIQQPEPTVKAVAESAMREIIGRNEIQPILTKSRQEVEEGVKALLQTTLDSYGAGIEVTQINLQKVDPPQEVIASFRDVQAARADQERLQNEAQSYANRVVPEARGDAQRILQASQGYREQAVAEASGRTERFLKVYDEYVRAPDVTRRRMFLETMERVLGGMDKIIIDDTAGAQAGGSGVISYLPLNEVLRPRPAPAAATGTQSGGTQ